FTKKDKGIGYLAGETDDPQIVRGYYIDNPAADRIADRARALRKAAGTLTGHAIGEDTTPRDGDGSSLLDDVAAVLLPGEDKVWSETIVTRLAELRPATYGAWNDLDPTGKAKHLAAALKPYGIATGQIWGQDETGKGGNRRGITTAHIRDALDNRDRAAP
ncbi:cell division protein FtsK, partial [Actinomadura sp. NPDC023710]